MGAAEKNIVAQAKRFGEPIPDRIANKPKLGFGLQLFLDIFYDLEHDRAWIVGNTAIPMPIKWFDIHNYCLAHSFSGELYQDVLYLVRELDSAYLKHIMKKTN